MFQHKFRIVLTIRNCNINIIHKTCEDITYSCHSGRYANYMQSEIDFNHLSLWKIQLKGTDLKLKPNETAAHITTTASMMFQNSRKYEPGCKMMPKSRICKYYKQGLCYWKKPLKQGRKRCYTNTPYLITYKLTNYKDMTHYSSHYYISNISHILYKMYDKKGTNFRKIQFFFLLSYMGIHYSGT